MLCSKLTLFFLTTDILWIVSSQLRFCKFILRNVSLFDLKCHHIWWSAHNHLFMNHNTMFSTQTWLGTCWSWCGTYKTTLYHLWYWKQIQKGVKKYGTVICEIAQCSFNLICSHKSIKKVKLLCLLGTIYLWMFWPSFNSAITAHGDDQHRTAMNTYYSLAACTLATYGMSALTAHDGKLDMVRTQDYHYWNELCFQKSNPKSCLPVWPTHTWRWFPEGVCCHPATPPPSHSNPENTHQQ